MKKILCCFVLLVNFTSCNAGNDTGNPDSVRAAVVAGQFYPADSIQLLSQIKVFLKKAKSPAVENAFAVIVPHAGYIYSGQIAADAYNQVKNNKYELVVVLGTNHTTAGFSGISVYPEGYFSTPLGNLKIDSDAASDLMKLDASVTVNPAVHEKEHSIEVQLPFVKYLFPDAKILPVIIADPDIQLCSGFAKALASVLKNKKALVVASSDLSHYPDFDDAVKVDNKTLKTIAGSDPAEISSVMKNQLEENIPGLETCACGEASILAAVVYSNEIGAERVSVISYSNSGYSPIGSADRVVGYGAVVFSKGKKISQKDVDKIMSDNSYVLSSADKKELLKYARETIDQYFENRTVPLPGDINPNLKIKRGAFVTLKKHSQLRGCIGHMAEDTPLCTIIGAMALQAAFNDRRFNPLRHDELPEVEIEISALTPFTKIKNADEIQLGIDGVIVKKGSRQAVFLPQVATETGWSKEMFLDQLCYKAGLNAGDWKSSELYTFQAVVFSESEFH